MEQRTLHVYIRHCIHKMNTSYILCFRICIIPTILIVISDQIHHRHAITVSSSSLFLLTSYQPMYCWHVRKYFNCTSEYTRMKEQTKSYWEHAKTYMWEEDSIFLILGIAGDAVARGPGLSEVQKIPFLLISFLHFQVILPSIQSAACHSFLINISKSVRITEDQRLMF